LNKERKYIKQLRVSTCIAYM